MTCRAVVRAQILPATNRNSGSSTCNAACESKSRRANLCSLRLQIRLQSRGLRLSLGMLRARNRCQPWQQSVAICHSHTRPLLSLIFEPVADSQSRLQASRPSQDGTYTLLSPDDSLRLQLRTISNLQGSTGPARKKLCYLLPREVLVLLQLNEHLIFLSAKLELWHSRT